jgi:hypothetical protein
VQPRIVSTWRQRFADHGLDGLKEQPRAGKKPIYGKVTNKRILGLLDQSPPAGYGRWSGPLLAKALGDVHVQYVWRFLREHNIELAARKSWCESNDPEFAAKAADVVGLYIAPPRSVRNIVCEGTVVNLTKETTRCLSSQNILTSYWPATRSRRTC